MTQSRHKSGYNNQELLLQPVFSCMTLLGEAINRHAARQMHTTTSPHTRGSLKNDITAQVVVKLGNNAI